MNIISWFNFLFVALCGLVGLRVLLSEEIRSAQHVLYDLDDCNEEESTSSMRGGFKLGDELAALGLFEIEEKRQFQRSQRTLPFLGLGGFLLIELLVIPDLFETVVPMCMFGLALGFIISRVRLKLGKSKFSRELEYILPVVMERIVMAVQSGLDVVSAIGIVVELGDDLEPDPVSRLLSVVSQLTQSGMGFEQALNEVAEGVEASSLKHAFIHLGVAYREGGELLEPLRELSDATQSYFQETVEEEIAKMPVRATAPLLCTFAGLIVCFITVPLLQILELTQRTAP